VGKTTTATNLGEKLGCAVRHCSEIILTEAARQKLAPPFPLHLHQWLDSDSRQWMERARSGCVVEGRFLHRVLANEHGTFFVHLTCSLEERARRLESVERIGQAAGRLQISDTEDEAHEKRVYSDKVATAVANLELDTSCLSPEGVASALVKALGERGYLAEDSASLPGDDSGGRGTPPGT
jgi:cytidylate kinase